MAIAGALILIGPVVVGSSVLPRTVADVGHIDPLARFLIALASIVLLCHLMGGLLRKLGQPGVIGEILGGIVLGPSVFGALWPGGRAWMFPPEVVAALEMVAQLGLVTFMFVLGCEMHVHHARVHRKAVGCVVAGGIGLPFAGGVAVAALAQPVLAGPVPQSMTYLLFFGLAVSITALPVLARILVDLQLDGQRLGVVALTSAAISDGIAWLALTVILAATGTGGTGQVITTAGLAASLTAFVVLCVRPTLAWVFRYATRYQAADQLLLPLLLSGAIAFAAATHLIGLHPVIGAFLFGLAVPRGSAVVTRISRQLHGFTVLVLLPLFFAGVGLSTSLGLLGDSPEHWLLFGVVLLVAIVTKFAGAAGAARLAGMPSNDGLRLGALMNCRGVTELVVATIGLQSQIINALGFTVLVLVALITTATTGPLMQVFAPRRANQDLQDEPSVREPDTRVG
ncbi:transporter (CPA2 family) [Saccharopolyspora erythraea NRRL 2338]|uniref:Cation/H+ exchanger transmembrane domain-containing protein n=1 Tax=Saccharopolyspora erythraea TaxID=1836 RepID=A0ABP3NRN2_SACER|nr:potassium transporter [Saccharopolyspora erythraea D]PFG97856.1 transporter (CPA2 family) [Saccharopolyspora erythraea NRRL 2338]